MSEPAEIAALARQASRPEFSVMIPTYRPTLQLVEALGSVLRQAPESGRMQIAIVDDASPDTDVAAMIAQVAPPGRISVIRNNVNVGLAGNWNRCIEHARGELVHILHQDDRVNPGFYSAMSTALRAAPEAGMAFCRCEFIDAGGRQLGAMRRRARRAGLVSNWLAQISEATRVQCPGVVVRRAVYERHGGYRRDLHYALDWEMWVRIAANYPVWYEPRLLAAWRKHAGSESSRLQADERADEDVLAAIRIFGAHLPPGQRARLLGRSYRRFVQLRLRHTARDLVRLEARSVAAQLALCERLMNELPAAASLPNRFRLWGLRRRSRSQPLA